MSEVITVAERYLSSTQSSDLRVRAEGSCDADSLLAAAYATMGDNKRDLALKVWRLRATGGTSGSWGLMDDMGEMLYKHLVREDKPVNVRLRSMRKRKTPLTRAQSNAVALKTLQWWKKPTCQKCGGHGHPPMPNAPVLDTSIICSACDGTGTTPLKNVVLARHLDHAEWLVHQMEVLSSMVFNDMSNLLAKQISL